MYFFSSISINTSLPCDNCQKQAQVANKKITAGNNNQIICRKAVNSNKGFLKKRHKNLAKRNRGSSKFQKKWNRLAMARSLSGKIIKQSLLCNT
jgi:hypothetical protein